MKNYLIKDITELIVVIIAMIIVLFVEFSPVIIALIENNWWFLLLFIVSWIPALVVGLLLAFIYTIIFDDI